MAVLTHVQATNFIKYLGSCAQGWLQAGLSALGQWVQHSLHRVIAMNGVGIDLALQWRAEGSTKQCAQRSRLH